MAAAQNMAVQVIHGLSAVGLAVDHKTGALFGAAVFFGEFLGFYKQLPKQCHVGGFSFHEVFYVFFGYYQEVNRRLGVDVGKGEKFIIFIQLFGRDFPADNLTE